MKSVKQPKKNNSDIDFEELTKNRLRKKRKLKLKNKTKRKKNMDWRNFLMEEEEGNPEDS